MDNHFRHNAKPSSCDGSHTQQQPMISVSWPPTSRRRCLISPSHDPAHIWPYNLQCCLRKHTMPLRQQNSERTMRATIRLQTM